MKILLQNKLWVALILSCSLALLFVSNCTPERGSEGTSSSASSGTSDGGSTDLKCNLIERCSGNKCKCSGSDCCKDNEDCEDKCTDTISRDGLDLSGDAKDTCFHMEEEVVEKLFDLIEDLEKPQTGRLRDIGNDEDDMALICSAVKELDYDLLNDRINKYSSSQAKKVLGWLAESAHAVAIFENAEDDKGLPMFENLLQQASSGGDSDDNKVLSGLSVDVSVEDKDDDEKHIMRWALENSNNELVRWIHDKIITEDDGLCGDDKKEENRPLHVDDTVSFTLEQHERFRDDYGEQACVLGVYCKIANADKSDDNGFRKDMAELIDNDVEVSDFIKVDVAEGGLGLSERVAEEWKYLACTTLKSKWLDVGLNLGLDGS